MKDSIALEDTSRAEARDGANEATGIAHSFGSLAELPGTSEKQHADTQVDVDCRSDEMQTVPEEDITVQEQLYRDSNDRSDVRPDLYGHRYTFLFEYQKLQ